MLQKLSDAVSKPRLNFQTFHWPLVSKHCSFLNMLGLWTHNMCPIIYNICMGSSAVNMLMLSLKRNKLCLIISYHKFQNAVSNGKQKLNAIIMMLPPSLFPSSRITSNSRSKAFSNATIFWIFVLFRVNCCRRRRSY